MQFYVLGFVHYTHRAAAQLFDDAIVRDVLAQHWRERYVAWSGKSTKPVEFAGLEKIVGEKSRFHLSSRQAVHLAECKSPHHQLPGRVVSISDA